MSKSSEEKQQLSSDLLGALESGEVDVSRPASSARWLLPALVVVIVVGLAAAGFAKLAGTFDSEGDSMLTHVVGKGELLVSITEDGNLESANNVDIKCEVAGGSTILWIIEDGQHVEKGDVLARLDSSQLEDQISQQKITYEKAKAAHIQAQKDYNVAKISVQEYLEGTYRQEIQDLEAQITIAMENLRSSENSLQHTERMFRKGYVSPLQREAQQFAVKRSKLELESARTAEDVLEKFTKVKMLEELQSQRDTAEARMKSEKAAFDLEEARLKRLEIQLEKCVILAPQAGMAVYANETSRSRMGSQQPQIEEGAMVRERQTIFRLPDTEQMQVKVAVHESKIDQLRLKMRALVHVLGQEFQGTVETIANQPEPTHFFRGNVKEYSTIVELIRKTDADDKSKESDRYALKPGMTAAVEILVAHLEDVVTLPVAAVVQQRGEFFCWVQTKDGIQRRPLVLGLSNDEQVEIKDGVTVGDEVIMNPRAMVAEAREDDQDGEQVDVDEKFGATPKAEAPKPDGGTDRQRRDPAEGQGVPGGPSSRSGPREQTMGAEGPPRSGGEGGPPDDGGQRGPGRGGGFDIMASDADGDGKVSREEAPSPLQDRFDMMDGNADGFIDAAEIQAMRERFRQEGGRPGGEGRGPGGGGLGERPTGGESSP